MDDLIRNKRDGLTGIGRKDNGIAGMALYVHLASGSLSLVKTKLGGGGSGMATNAAAAITTGSVLCVSLWLTNLSSTDAIFFGTSAAQVTRLAPGERLMVPATSAAEIYVKRAALGDAAFSFQTIIEAT